MTHEEFDKRLEASNERLRQEIADTQERVQRLEALLARKKAFLLHLDQVLAEIEREEQEIAVLEKGLHSPRYSTRRRPSASQALR